MRGNIVWAAAVLGICLVVASGLLVWGVWFSLDRASGHVAAAIRHHGSSTEMAGARAGDPIQKAVLDLAAATEKHAASIEAAGERISQPTISVERPLPVEQPVRIIGPREDGALPVNAVIGK